MSGIGRASSFSLNKFRNIKGPIIDIRSPNEFNQGHWPGAKNIPLFNDDERAIVGTAYKRKGRQKAIDAGLNIVLKKLNDLKRKLEQEKEESSRSNLRIYCWRGGLRSASVGWLANVLGLEPVLLNGGYKTYRNWVLRQFEKQWVLKLLGGKTGTGKTDLLLELSKSGIYTIDLEGLANHKGSSFGGLGQKPQPSCEQFENRLAQSLYLADKHPQIPIWLEAESANLGRCRIPNAFFSQMKNAPLLEITRSKEERIKALVNEYSKHKTEDLKEATLRISKRLGPQRTKKALESIQRGAWGDACFAMLDYYDRCYEYELQKNSKKTTVDITGLNINLSIERIKKSVDLY